MCFKEMMQLIINAPPFRFSSAKLHSNLFSMVLDFEFASGAGVQPYVTLFFSDEEIIDDLLFCADNAELFTGPNIFGGFWI